MNSFEHFVHFHLGGPAPIPCTCKHILSVNSYWKFQETKFGIVFKGGAVVIKLRRDFSLAEGQIKRLFALCTSVIFRCSSQFTTLIHYKTYTFVCVSTLLHLCNKLRTSMTWRFTYFLWSFGVLNFAERHTPQIWHWLSGTPLRASGSIGSWSLCSPVNWDMAYSETSRCGHYLILTVCF